MRSSISRARTPGLLSTSIERRFNEDGNSNEDTSGGVTEGRLLETEADYQAFTEDREALPDSIPGVLLNTTANQDHWLSAGYEKAVALVTGARIYTPLNAADGTNVFRFEGPRDLLASGYLWEENRPQLAYKPFVMIEPAGRGYTIGFTSSPTTRAYLDGLNLLLANAVLFAPAHAR